MAPAQKRHLLFCVAPVIYVTAVPIRVLLAEDVLRSEGLHVDVVGVLCLPALVLLALPLAERAVEACAGSGKRAQRLALLPCLVLQIFLLLGSLIGLLLWRPSNGAESVREGPSKALVPFRQPQGAEHPATRSPQLGSVALRGRSQRESATENTAGAALGSTAGALAGSALGRGKISVVLPCASEGEFAVKTVQSFCDRTPAEVLQEILVVDDGSQPPMEEILRDVDKRCRLRVLRHPQTQGLMVAKQTGGDAAVGEFLGFFDCHVAPNRGWHVELVEKLRAHPVRLVVPTITDLDLDTWDEKRASSSNSKCYISWDAEFMWFEDESDYIPVISGGLVATSLEWWRLSGGFDKGMRGWGGENVDQSLRTWLCGGDIVRAKSSRVAHMWRVPEDQRTQVHYHLVKGSDNNARVAAAWFDDFAVKFGSGRLARNSPDVSATLVKKKALKCRPFAYFLHRFRRVYRDGGILPHQVFKLRSSGGKLCAQLQGDRFHMKPCGEVSTYFHLANQNPKQQGKCCSGIRLWNSLQCFDRLDPEGPLPYYCDVTGHNLNQQYHWSPDGLIKHGTGRCLTSFPEGRLAPSDCGSATCWHQEGIFEPKETTLYEAAVRQYNFSEDSPDN